MGEAEREGARNRDDLRRPRNLDRRRGGDTAGVREDRGAAARGSGWLRPALRRDPGLLRRGAAGCQDHRCPAGQPRGEGRRACRGRDRKIRRRHDRDLERSHVRPAQPSAGRPRRGRHRARRTGAAGPRRPRRAPVVLDWALDRRAILKLGVVGAAAALVESIRARIAKAAAAPLPTDARERRLASLRQLTFGGQNAEAYFDWTGTRLIFQSTRPPFACDQIFTMRDTGSDLRRVSTGEGRTTCSFFFPDGKRFIYASTHLGGAACPTPPDRSRGYVWPIYPTYEIFSADLDGGHLTRLTDNEGYDAEGAVSPDGRRIVFTSLRDGDLDLYLMDADGANVRRLTDRPG